MLYEICRYDALSVEDISQWNEIVETEYSLSSPFFHPGFTRVVSEVRDDVWVITGRNDGRLELIWPIQKAGRAAEPIGAPFSDYHGPVVRQTTAFDPQAMLDGVGLHVMRMNGVYDPSCRLHEFAQEFDGTFVVDIRNGVEAYFEQQQVHYPRHAKKQRRIERKMEREVGGIEFNFDDRNVDHWDTLMSWKQRQYKETGRHNVLGPEWVRKMLQSLWESDDDSCRGYLSTISHKDRLIAAEFNLGNRSTIHGWVPAYDPDFRSYSPGNMLQDYIINAMEGRGLRYYDLGVSAGYYKKYYVDYQLPVIRGTVRSVSVMSAIGSANERLWLSLEDAHIPKISNVLGQIRRRYDIIRAAEPSFCGRVAGVANAAKFAVNSAKPPSESHEDA